MAVNALAAGPAPTRPSSALQGPPLPPFPVSVIAAAVSCLTGTAITVDDLIERAVGRGLHRLTDVATPDTMAGELVARLLVADHRLPALVEESDPERVRDHLRARRRVLAVTTSETPALHEIHGFFPADDGSPHLLMTDLTGRPGALEDRGADWLDGPWTASGRLLVVAARRWDDLPRSGRAFFGGSREADGTYYWCPADCVTDRHGDLLRCH